MISKKFSILAAFFICGILFGQDFKVLTSTSQQIIIEYTPVYSDTLFISGNSGPFFKINFKGAQLENLGSRGGYQIPFRPFNIGVPSELGNSIQIISSEYSTISGKYLPVPSLIKDSLGFSEVFIEGDAYNKPFSKELVSFGEFGLLRNLPVQTVNVYPVQFNPQDNSVKVYSKIVFKMNFGNGVSSARSAVESFLEPAIINFDVAKNWGIAESKLNKISSVQFSTGDWFRFEAVDEGIYKIDRATLTALGVNVDNLDPRTLKIFNHGATNLPERVSTFKNDELVENAILVEGENDGRFDQQDYILFYARPTNFWEYDKTRSNIVRRKHSFSKKNFYWLTFGGSTGKRMSAKPSVQTQNAFTQSSTWAFRFVEKDSINIGKSGRDYFGDILDANVRSRRYLNTLNNLIPNTKVRYNARVVNTSESAIPFTLEEGETRIYSSNLSGIASYIFGREDNPNVEFAGQYNEDRSNVRFAINTTSSTAKVYVDYLNLAYQSYLRAASDQFILFSKDTTATIDYTIMNFSGSSIQAFDITDFANVKIITGAAVSGGQINFKANEIARNVSKYFVVNSSAFKTPVNGTKVANSNVRSASPGTEMILITAKEFKSQAERYASYRNSQSPYKHTVSIFYVDEILNEFSSGMMDPMAIRDFLKYAYANWQVKPFYVLFFGDGDYDYFNNEKLNRNFVPTYQTVESLDQIHSYTSDDYFARVSGDDGRIDLAIGRLNFQTPQEADILIDKIVKYEKELEKGLWRNLITLIADDGPAATGEDDGSLHTYQSENLSQFRIPKYFDQKKIYLATYPTVVTGLGRRKPSVNRAIVDAVNNGTLILNYIGHGNPATWAHEYVFEKASTIPQLKNQNYFFLTAATCDFGKYDDPAEQSSTEIMINMRDAGMIGAFTAARVVYASSNAVINDSFYTNLFRKNPFDKSQNSIGRAYFLTKQFLFGFNDEKFHLFSDPALRLAQPLLSMSIDSVNGKISSQVSQIRALDNVTINGTVRNQNGSASDFNGDVIVSVFDSGRTLELKEMNYSMNLQGGLIFRGRSNVVNGRFKSEFVVPKDISYENKNGKISAYAFNSLTDGVGYSNNIIVGGTNPDAVNDGKGPVVEIFFDDFNFSSSYLVNPDFYLLAKISDQTGLNTTGTGIGHKLEAILNDDETNAIDLTNSFVGDLNSAGKSGIIKYRFTNFAPGGYNIKIKAWDVFNNSSLADVNFTVVNADAGLVIRDVVNYPNPFSSNTTFTFQHNHSSEVNAIVKIYTVAGRLIQTLEANNLIDKFVKVDWDGRDADGNMVANGTYIYKVILESGDGSLKETAIGKAAIIR